MPNEKVKYGNITKFDKDGENFLFDADDGKQEWYWTGELAYTPDEPDLSWFNLPLPWRVRIEVGTERAKKQDARGEVIFIYRVRP